MCDLTITLTSLFSKRRTIIYSGGIVEEKVVAEFFFLGVGLARFSIPQKRLRWIFFLIFIMEPIWDF